MYILGVGIYFVTEGMMKLDKMSFEREIRMRLSDIPEKKLNMYLKGYSDIIDSMVENGMNEEQAVASLGTPDALAAKIRTRVESEEDFDSFRSYGSDRYGDGFDRGVSSGASDNSYYQPPNYQRPGSYESVSGTVRNAPNGDNRSPGRYMVPGASTERIILIIVACILFLPALIGMYIAAVGVFIAGAAATLVGFFPLFAGAAMRGLLFIGGGMILLGLSILMMMGLNRLIKLVTGHYRLIR